MENKCHTLTSQLDSSNYELQIVQKTLEEEKKIVLNLQKQLDDLKKVNSNTQAQIQLNNTQKEEKEELIALRKEVAEYEAEFKMLKNQDITIKKLNARIEEMSRNSEEELQRELK
jgi:homeobox protein cut-like